MTLVNKGFTLESVIEARPRDSIVDTMIDEMRRPMMLIVKARKL